MRDLLVAYTGLRREWWSHTANKMVLFANANRDAKKSRAYILRDFLPEDLRVFSSSVRGIPLTPSTLRAMKPLFVKEG
jgi:hypothetical protein